GAPAISRLRVEAEGVDVVVVPHVMPADALALVRRDPVALARQPRREGGCEHRGPGVDAVARTVDEPGQHGQLVGTAGPEGADVALVPHLVGLDAAPTAEVAVALHHGTHVVGE